MIDTFPLDCLDLEPSVTWTLAEEDPLVYLREDTEGYNPKRQWKDPFPKVPEPAPNQPGPQPAPRMDMRKPLAMHHVLVDWCHTLGEDPCKEYQKQNIQYLLEAVPPKATVCPVCQKTLSNTQRLKAHIRASHMEQTPYHCAICDRYFADKATLNLHNKRHDTSSPLYVCATCNKAHTVKSRFKEHEKVHLPGATNLPCQYCSKIIKEKKNLVSHESNCKQNPARSPRKNCPYCTKDFQQKKDLAYHVKTKHPSRVDTWQADFV